MTSTGDRLAAVPELSSTKRSLRILFAGERWHGSDAYAYERALLRAGHAVTPIETAVFVPSGWQALWLRAMRRVLKPLMIAEYERAVIDAVNQIQPHLFVGFKAPYVTPKIMRVVKDAGVRAINIYPDISFMAHGPYLPKTLPLYDWVFTTKSFGLVDMERQLGIRRSSFLPPAFDPELHFPIALDNDDWARYGADISFIGTWSPKKERLLEVVARSVSPARIRIWGSSWHKATSSALRDAIENKIVIGREYPKAVRASRINLALLSEQGAGASSGDLITQRTFGMPACGGFMLHERTPEVIQYFEEGTECALYSGEEELVEKVQYYLNNEEERARVAEAGRKRALASGYSVDARVGDIIAKFDELNSA